MSAILPATGLRTFPMPSRYDGGARPLAVFDLDGTLVDTAPDLTASLNHCLAYAGHPTVGIEDLRPHAGKGARAMLAYGFGEAGVSLSVAEMDAAFDRFLRYYTGHIADHSVPFDGAVAALDRLECAGFLLAVCTNKFEAHARLLLAALGLEDRFAAICGADTFARRKPDPTHLLGTIDLAGGHPAHAVMIGDSPPDIEAAAASGVPSILMAFGYGSHEPSLASPDLVLASFDEIDPSHLVSFMDEHEAIA